MTTERGVIFDIGGVLVRCGWDAPACRPLVSAVGNQADIFAVFTADGMFSRLNAGTLAPEDFAREAIGRFGLPMTVEEFRAAWTGIFSPMPGMMELLGEVALKWPVTLLSDTDPWHWEALRTLFPALAAVAKPVLSFEHGKVKPDPALYRAAAEAVGVDRRRCVFIDDRPPNVEGARAAGMSGILFADAATVRSELQRLGY